MIEDRIEEAARKYAFNECSKKDIDLYDLDSLLFDAFCSGINWFQENLFHDASKVPDRVKEILLEQEINGKKQHQAYMFNGASFFREHCRKCGVTRWLYIEDLMKGGK